MLYKKEKRSLTWIVVGLIAVAIIGTVVYFAWPRTNNYGEESQQLQAQLSALKSEINNLPDSSQRTLLKGKVLDLESQINDFTSQQKQNKSTVKRLENEIKKLKKRLENERPDEDSGPGRAKEGKFFFCGTGIDSKGNENYMFDEYEGGRDRMINISKDHPLIKELLSQGKLKKVNFNQKESFLIYFDEKDDYGTRSKFFFFFNEFSTKLKIIKDGDEPEDDYEDQVSTIFRWSNSDKSGYQLFKGSAEQKGIKVYVAKDHSFIKGKRLDDSESTPPFSIRFKKNNSSKQEGGKNFYFDKDNTNFELGAFDDWPDETEKNERKLEYVKENSLGNHVFSDSPDDAQIFFIVDKNHPRIKQMLSEGKLKAGKEFIIRYGKVDKNFTSISFFFNKNNEELEIIENS